MRPPPAARDATMTVGTTQANTGESLAEFTDRLVTDALAARTRITAPSGGAEQVSDTKNTPHDAKVSSVLLPIYRASEAQKSDVYKGYDKITTSPTHVWCCRDRSFIVARRRLQIDCTI